jgi:hypothetical protein
MNSESLVSAIFSKDGDSAVDAFNAAIASKIADALEVRKVEVASNFISAPAEAPAEQIEASTEA